MRTMWTMVFFDLPVTTKADRHAAAAFRRFLQNDGYMMLQWSVYAKVGSGVEVDKTALRHLTKNLPPSGNIRVIQLTDHQFGRMQLLVGERSRQEKLGSKQLILL